MNAEDVFETIKQLENEERWKLLNMMYDEYYSTGTVPKAEIETTEN